VKTKLSGVSLVKMGHNFKLLVILFLTAKSFCECKNLFELQANNSSKNYTKQPSSLYLSRCDSNNDCFASDRNLRCVDYKCRCAPNYNYEAYDQKCKFFSCYDNIECRTYDEYRYCLDVGYYGTCNCDTNYYVDYSNGDKCTYSYIFNMTLVWIVVGVVLALKISLIVIAIHRHRKSKNKSKTSTFVKINGHVRTNPAKIRY
jgi:hypothetical protein